MFLHVGVDLLMPYMLVFVACLGVRCAISGGSLFSLLLLVDCMYLINILWDLTFCGLLKYLPIFCYGLVKHWHQVGAGCEMFSFSNFDGYLNSYDWLIKLECALLVFSWCILMLHFVCVNDSWVLVFQYKIVAKL